MKIAYLVNQYPKISHSFIRREIEALEAYGVQITRFAIRYLVSELFDLADQEEFKKTRYILNKKISGLILHSLHVVFTRPLSFLKGIRLALKVGLRSDRGLILHFAYLAEACVLLDWCQQEDISHLHVHFGTNSATVAMFCRVLGGPSYSITIHGPEEFDKPTTLSLAEKIHHAAFAIAVCSFGKSQLFRWCHYQDWSKIHLIRCGVDELFLDQPEVPLPRQARFVCVGRMIEQKGHLLLVEAVSYLAAEGWQFKVILIGDGPLRPAIEALIAHFGVEDYIEIAGWATNLEVQQHILAAQVLVAPSFAEGLPVVIMESLALARPVISTYIAGIPELVEHGKCGWLVPAGSAKALASAMRAVLQTSVEDLTQMGKAGTERISRYHNARIEAHRLKSLFQTYTTDTTAVKPKSELLQLLHDRLSLLRVLH